MRLLLYVDKNYENNENPEKKRKKKLYVASREFFDALV